MNPWPTIIQCLDFIVVLLALILMAVVVMVVQMALVFGRGKKQN